MAQLRHNFASASSVFSIPSLAFLALCRSKWGLLTIVNVDVLKQKITLYNCINSLIETLSFLASGLFSLFALALQMRFLLILELLFPQCHIALVFVTNHATFLHFLQKFRPGTED